MRLDESVASEEKPPERGAGRLRLPLLFLALLAVIFVIQVTPVRGHVATLLDWQRTLGESGPWAPLLFVGMTAVLVALGVPRLVFCFTGGLVFGFVEGLIWSQVGSLLGAYGLFVAARWGGRDWVRRWTIEHPRYEWIGRQTPTFWTVFLIRQVPAPGLIPNVLLGLTPVRHQVFLLGSFFGYLPEASVAALAGSGLISSTLATALPQVFAAIGLMIVAGWIIRHACVHFANREPVS